jgi:asparagine synthase (glutamine-hydrolysing)
MCGICIVWAPTIDAQQFNKSLSMLIPRGPDGTHTQNLFHTASQMNIAMGFTRLHIQGDPRLEQPFNYGNGERYLVCNGEIFNSDILIEELGLTVPPGSSDCAVIPALIERGMGFSELCRQLDGDFAIVEVDVGAGIIRVARDPYGVRPLYYGEGPTWRAIVSEIKAFPADITRIDTILPGSWRAFMIDASLESTTTGLQEIWHEVPWLKTPYWRSSLEGLCQAGSALRDGLEEAVEKRLTTVRAVGACLSGGLDSSLVAAIAANILRKRGKKLHTYSIGMSGSTDLAFARKVANHIGSIHHERIVTAEECLALIPEVIRSIETFDITTVRASVGNYLVGQLVRQETPTVKVVLNGDGADEAMGGYLYMRAAPSNTAFETETTRLLTDIHRYDVLRSERSMAANGLESRSPFLDRQFLSIVRGIPTDAMRSSEEILEKSMMRSAFDNTDILPEDVLWRPKEAFSDGMSRADKSWYEMAQEEGERMSSGETPVVYDVNPPQTAEARWYRRIFHTHYPAVAAETVPAMWMPRFVNASDPSARTLSMYATS